MVTSEKLKKVRTRLGESQEKFAERFDVDQSTIHRWETDGPPDRGPTKIAIETVMISIGNTIPVDKSMTPVDMDQS